MCIKIVQKFIKEEKCYIYTANKENEKKRKECSYALRLFTKSVAIQNIQLNTVKYGLILTKHEIF